MSQTAVDLASVVDREIWRREGWNDGNLSFQSTLSRKMLLPAEGVDRASSSVSIKERECRRVQMSAKRVRCVNWRQFQSRKEQDVQ